MSEYDKRKYWEIKSDPVKYAAYRERKRLERLARVPDPNYERERKRKWRERNPATAQRIKDANHAVQIAIEQALLERPKFCSRCGSEGSIEGHHRSYAKEHWLVVIWLCQKCHSFEHHN